MHHQLRILIREYPASRIPLKAERDILVLNAISGHVEDSLISSPPWIRQNERDSGKRDGVTTDERARMKELERENRELRRANEILRKASAYLAQASMRPPTEAMTQFIDDHRREYGVESICRVMREALRRPTTSRRRGRPIRHVCRCERSE